MVKKAMPKPNTTATTTTTTKKKATQSARRLPRTQRPLTTDPPSPSTAIANGIHLTLDHVNRARTSEDYQEFFRKSGIPEDGVQCSENDATAYVRIARLCPTLYGDEETTERLKDATATTKGYNTAKKATITRFYKFLASHSDVNMRQLADVMPDPEQDGLPEFRFVILTRGIKNTSKRVLFNMCMCVFAINAQKQDPEFELTSQSTAPEKAEAQYQPSTMNTFYKHIFAYCSNCSILFASSDFLSFPGSFHAATKIIFKETLVHRPDFGMVKRASVDLRARYKIREHLMIKGINVYGMSLDPNDANQYWWLVALIVLSVGEAYALRGTYEVRSNSLLSPLNYLSVFAAPRPVPPARGLGFFARLRRAVYIFYIVVIVF